MILLRSLDKVIKLEGDGCGAKNVLFKSWVFLTKNWGNIWFEAWKRSDIPKLLQDFLAIVQSVCLFCFNIKAVSQMALAFWAVTETLALTIMRPSFEPFSQERGFLQMSKTKVKAALFVNILIAKNQWNNLLVILQKRTVWIRNNDNIVLLFQ